MKTVYGCFEKGHETHEKKKKNLFSRTKLKSVYQIKKFWWVLQILFYKHGNSFAKMCTKQVDRLLEGIENVQLKLLTLQ